MKAQCAPSLDPNQVCKTIWFTNEAGVTVSVPADPNNADYVKIMWLVGEGKLVIAPAEAT